MVAFWIVFYVYPQLDVGFRAFAFFYAQLLDSHASPNIGSTVTPAHPKKHFGIGSIFYRLSHRRKSVIKTVPGEILHREHGGLTTTRGCLIGFVRKKTAHAREINGKESSQRAPPFSLWMVGV